MCRGGGGAAVRVLPFRCRQVALVAGRGAVERKRHPSIFVMTAGSLYIFWLMTFTLCAGAPPPTPMPSDDDILMGATEGEREAAWAVLLEKGTTITANSRVTEIKGGETGAAEGISGAADLPTTSSAAGSEAAGGDLSKRMVYLKGSAGQQQVWGQGQG